MISVIVLVIFLYIVSNLPLGGGSISHESPPGEYRQF